MTAHTRNDAVPKALSSSADPVLEVDSLRVRFPAGKAWVEPVRGISFTVERGQRLGLVGESGSGKSLTALAIMRLIRAPGEISDGEVRLNGRNLLPLDEGAMARVRGAQVAMVYQNPLSSLNPVRTIGEQIAEAIRTHERVSKQEARERSLSLLREVGVPRAAERYGNYPHQFSGGMRQRVVMAMALAADPDLLIADEATTALDVTTQARIIELLRKLVEERNTAVIFITHDLGVAAGFCTDVQVMYAGRIVERALAGHFYHQPTHPYSEALMGSICRLDTDVTRSMPAIAGQPPLPGSLPHGCPFHPRCPAAVDVCSKVEPQPQRFLDGELVVECHRADERLAVAHGKVER